MPTGDPLKSAPPSQGERLARPDTVRVEKRNHLTRFPTRTRSTAAESDSGSNNFHLSEAFRPAPGRGASSDQRREGTTPSL